MNTAWLTQLFDSIARFLNGSTERADPSLQTQAEHNWPLSPSWTLVFAVAAILYVSFIYWREAGQASRFSRTLLAAMRVLLVVIAGYMLYGWMIRPYRTDLADIVIVVDDSLSMRHADQYDAALQSAVERWLGESAARQPTRAAMAQAVLLHNQQGLLAAAAEQNRLKVYWAADTTRRLAATDLEGLTAELQNMATQPVAKADGASPPASAASAGEAHASRLGAAVVQVLAAQRGRSTAAVIVLTDGITTAGPPLSEAALAARRRAIPLYVVGLGEDQPPRDLRLADLLVEDTVLVGDLVHFDAVIGGTGYEGKAVEVRLKEGSASGNIVARESITLPADASGAAVRLSHRPQQAGQYEYTMEVALQPDEAIAENNVETRQVEVRDASLRVLLVQSAPNWEYRYLKSLLGRGRRPGGGDDPQPVELKVVRQEADPPDAQQDRDAAAVVPVAKEELFKYDAVILSDANPARLSRPVMENLVEYVKVRGGGLVMIAGPRHLPQNYHDTPLAELLPFDSRTVSLPLPQEDLTEEIQVRPTSLGWLSPAMQLGDNAQENRQVWDRLPGIYWMVDTPDLKAGARVLAAHSTKTGRNGQPMPLISMQYVGAGKVVFHHFEETYRWRYRAGDMYFARYWLQTLRTLSRASLLGGSRGAELTTDRNQYRHGEGVRLRVRFLDERLAPAEHDGAVVMLEQDGGRKTPLTLERRGGNRSVFEGEASDLPQGRYRAWLAAPALEGDPPSQRFEILAPQGELARLAMDSADLKLAAGRSGGRFYTIATVHQLADDLPPGREVKVEALPPEPVWNSWKLALLFVMLIVGEWLLRKRVGMV